MKKLMFIVVLMASAAWGDKASNFTDEAGVVTVSTQPALPTLIFSKDSNALKSVIVNSSGFDVCIGTSNVGLSTTTSFAIPTGTVFVLDGYDSRWTGSIYGVMKGTTTPQGIGRYRTK